MDNVRSLAAQIDHHNRMYWLANDPEIPDTEFDDLVRELHAIAPEHPVLHRRYVKELEEKEKVIHATPMMSLEKVYTREEMVRWFRKTPAPRYLLNPKFDGCAGRLNAQGLLSTSGGENISDKIPYIEFVGVEGSSGKDVNGELLIRLSSFATMNGKYKNPRNAVAGALGLKEARDMAERKVEFVPHDHLSIEVTAREVLKSFDKLMALFPDASEIEDFPRDGWVLKVKDEKLRERYGVRTDCPKWAVAIKFVNSRVQTRLLGITWQVSRLGVVTPVALLQAVDVDGVTVTSASLHNLAECKRLGLAVPSTVMVERAGMVIPKVTRVVDTAGGEKWTRGLPTRCPRCGERLSVDMPRLVCRNKACPGRKTGAFLNLLGAFEIKGFQEARIADLLDRGIVEDPCDLFSVEPADLAPSLGETMAAKFVRNIQASLAGKVSKERFLSAFGIDGLGESTAKKLLDHVGGDLERVFGLSVEEIASIKGLGTSIARKVVEGFAGQGIGLWECLREKILFKGDIEPFGPWSGLTFCLTGKFSGPKKALEDLIVRSGGAVVGEVTKGLDYLVQANPSSVSEKSKRAKALGVKILSEDALWRLQPFRAGQGSSAL